MAKKKKGVQAQEIILIIVTFFMGIVAGWYLYVTAFAPHFSDYIGQTEAVYEDLVVVGEQYGGIRLGTAPSFQVLKNGSFNYLAYAAEGESARHLDGTLPPALWKTIKADMTRSKLESLAKPTADIECVSAADGIDYTYEVTLNSVVYTLDTCTTNLGHAAATTQTLDKLWTYFRTLE